MLKTNSKKKAGKFLLVSILILACFFNACDISQSDPEPKQIGGEAVEAFDYGPRTYYEFCQSWHRYGNLPGYGGIVRMEVELVNNTGEEVTILSPGGFHIGPGYTDSYLYQPREFTYKGKTSLTTQHTAAGLTTSVFSFAWLPYDPIVIEPKDWQAFHCPDCGYSTVTAGEFKERFRPYMKSFLLEVHVGQEKAYLAGWPESLEFSAENIDWFDGNWHVTGDRVRIDPAKIVQYGLGYSDNKEVFIYREHDPWHGITQHYNIKYADGEGRTAEYNNPVPALNITDYPVAVRNLLAGKAVITVDAPDKITYKTVSFEVVPQDY